MAMASLANSVSSTPFVLSSSSQGRQPLQKLQLATLNLKMPTNSERRNPMAIAMIRASATTLDTFFGGGEEDGGSTNGPPSFTLEDLEKEEEKPKCPPGLRPYETMAVLRPDISEEDRLSLTQRYEEKIVAGGGMCVEVFNRGFIPLAYAIRKKFLSGQKSVYFDGIFLLFTYFTKPECIPGLEKLLNKDDDIIRASTVIVRHRKD